MIAKIVYPEVEVSATQGSVKVVVDEPAVNLLDAAAHGASDGLRIGLQVIAMLIGFLALLALIDGGIGQIGLGLAHLGVNLSAVGLDVMHLTLKSIFGSLFAGVALALGVPWQDAHAVGGLMGTKLFANEFVAYSDLNTMMAPHPGGSGMLLTPKALAISTFALCGFANFGSVAMQIGGIGELAPERKGDLARLGLKALLCGTMASYISSAMAGIILSL